MRKKPIIIVEQWFNKPNDEVWSAITDHKQMTCWFFENIPAFEPVVGFETAFDVTSKNRIFRHLWRIEKVQVGKMIQYNWQYLDIEGVGYVTFELTEIDSKTRLRVTNSGLETFPDDIPEFSQESCRGGWEYFINERLQHYLSSK